jgi:hypothetical protein
MEEINPITCYRPEKRLSGKETYVFSRPDFMEKLNLVVQEKFDDILQVTDIALEEIEPDLFKINITGYRPIRKIPPLLQNKLFVFLYPFDSVGIYYDPNKKYVLVEDWRTKFIITSDNELVKMPDLYGYSLTNYERRLLLGLGKDVASKISSEKFWETLKLNGKIVSKKEELTCAKEPIL